MARANRLIIAVDQSGAVFGETPVYYALNVFTAYFGFILYKKVDYIICQATKRVDN
jgi:hypothetical protein